MQTLRIADIRTDGGTQPRAELSWYVIDEYKESLLSGATFPPVTVFYDGTDYWLADGFHRLRATEQADRDTTIADVKQGTQRDAMLYSVGANAVHGLRRTNADKRRAVEVLLRDAEWQQWSDSEIARRCAVSQSTVSRIRQELTSDPTYALHKSDARKGADGRTINTANIGKTPAPSPQPAQDWPLMDVGMPTDEDEDEPYAPEPTPMPIPHSSEGAQLWRDHVQAAAESPEAVAAPVDAYLRKLEEYQRLDRDALAAWLSLSEPADCERFIDTLDRVMAWANTTRKIIAQHQQGGLRIVR